MTLISHKATRQIAFLSIFASSLTIIILLIAIPTLILKTNKVKIHAEEKSSLFMKQSQRLWSQITQTERPNNDQKIQFFSRAKKSPFLFSVCQCYSLSCPLGMSGDTGISGSDGVNFKNDLI